MLKKSTFIFIACLGLSCCGTNKEIVLSAAPKSDSAQLDAAQLYEQGKIEATSGKEDEAITTFQAAKIIYDSDPRKLELAIAYSRYVKYKSQIFLAHKPQNNLMTMIAELKSFIDLHPNDAALDYAYFLMGCAYFELYLGKLYSRLPLAHYLRNLQQAKESFAIFKVLTTEYPSSIYARDASMRMHYLRDQIAKAELAIAKFYYDHKAYVAASNRTLYIVQNLYSSSCLAQALIILKDCYVQLDRQDLAQKISPLITNIK